MSGTASHSRRPAPTIPAKDYDLVAFFNFLHDMGNPVGAGKHVKETLAKDRSWMIVEPFAHDNLKDNLNPVGCDFYHALTLVCTPAPLSQEVGLGLGTQAGEGRLRQVDVGRVQPLPPRHRDAVQHGVPSVFLTDQSNGAHRSGYFRKSSSQSPAVALDRRRPLAQRID